MEENIKYITLDEVTELMNRTARQDFKDSASGYSKAEVDSFLDQVAEGLYEVTRYMQAQQEKEDRARMAMPEPIVVEKEVMVQVPVPAPAAETPADAGTLQ